MSESSQFVASNFNQTIPSKSIAIPSQHQLEIHSGDTIRFDIPEYIGFIDPRQSYLKFDLKITAPVRCSINEKVGSQGIINNLRIWNGESSTQLENIENYAEYRQLVNHYNSNESIKNKRALLEAVEIGTELKSMDFFTTYTDGADVGTTIATNENKVQVAMPIHSGILGGHQVFPVALLGGLRVEIDTNPANKILRAVKLGTEQQPLSNNTAIADAASTDTYVLFGTSADTEVATSNMSQCPFIVGQELIYQYTNTSDEEEVVSMGTIKEINYNAGIEIVFDVAFTAPADQKGGTSEPGEAMIYVDEYWANTQPISYTLNNVEIVFKQVQPPANYLSSLNNGTTIDIQTLSVVRNNVASTETITQQTIPSFNVRAKAIITLPMEQATNTIFRDNLAAHIDGMIRYNYYVNGKSQPNRQVETSALTRGYVEQIALWELQKSLGACNVPVRNISYPQLNFAIGRALGRYGGVYNLRDSADLQLKCEYDEPEKNKLFLNYICHLRQLKISSNNVIVIV